MEFIFGWLLGVIVGATVYRTWCCRPFGTIKIDLVNPEKDVYRIEIRDLDELLNKKRIVLNVDANANLSQE